VRFERTYPHPVERVWAAITEPSQLAHWFPSNVAIEPRAGGRIEFSGDPYAEASSGRVLVFEPPTRLVFTCAGDELHFELEAISPGGCRLTLVDVLEERDAAARNAAGWSVCLTELENVLTGVRSGGPHGATAEFPRWYEAHLAAGLPAGAAIPDAPLDR
jgi:uncharacterized protein YndB with AHSA1/START domain